MNRLAVASCAVAALGMTGCAHDPQTRGALRGGGIGAAAGAVASLFIPGLGLVGGAALGGIGGAGIGAATAKDKHYRHEERSSAPTDREGRPIDQRAPADAAPEAPPGG
jgi:osmotically inducible lipoprotein OsmB